MEDTNQNMIPDKWDRLILRVGAAATAILGSTAAILKATGGNAPLWLLIAAAVIPSALTVFAFGSGK